MSSIDIDTIQGVNPRETAEPARASWLLANRPGLALTFTGALCIFVGLALAVSGVWLISPHGSPFTLFSAQPL